MQLFDEVLILLLAAIVTVTLFRRLRIPPSIGGYLPIGTIVGPHGLGLIPRIKVAAEHRNVRASGCMASVDSTNIPAGMLGLVPILMARVRRYSIARDFDKDFTQGPPARTAYRE